MVAALGQRARSGRGGSLVGNSRSGFRSRAALVALTGADVNAATTALDPARAERAARRLRIPVTDLRANARVDVVLRRRLVGKSRDFVVECAEALAGGPLAAIVTALGDHSGDPSLDELTAALTPTIDAFGPRLTALVLAVAVDRDFEAAPHCAHLLDVDARLGALPDEPLPTAGSIGCAADDHAVKVEARRARKRARAEQRAAQRTSGPARYRRVRTATPQSEQPSPEPVPTPAPPPQAASRRAIRPVRAIRDLRVDDPLVGAVVFAPIRFRGEAVGIKDRPCVVIAAAGPRNLVVRPCYSEGGFRTRTWRSVEVQDLESAGLRRGTWVSDEEHVIRRHDVKRRFGTLAVSDWNML